MTLHEVEQVEAGKWYIVAGPHRSHRAVYGKVYREQNDSLGFDAENHNWGVDQLTSAGAKFYGPIELNSQTDGEDGDGNNTNG